MDSQFSIIAATDRAQAMKLLHDYAETTHFPEKLDEILHYLLQQQMICFHASIFGLLALFFCGYIRIAF